MQSDVTGQRLVYVNCVSVYTAFRYVILYDMPGLDVSVCVSLNLLYQKLFT